MTLAEIVSLRLELGRCRRKADDALGTAMLLLDKAERDLRATKSAPPPHASFSYDLDNPLSVSDCERCGFAWQACSCEPNGGRT